MPEKKIDDTRSGGRLERDQQGRIKPKKKWVKPVMTALFILLNIVVIAVTAINEFGNSENAAELSEVKIQWWLLVPAVSCFAVAIFIDIAKYVMMIRWAGEDKKRAEKRHEGVWTTARRTVILGKYYDSITPLSLGGQPCQIYYMHKHSRVSEEKATSIPLVGMVTTQMGFLIVGLIAFTAGAAAINNMALVTTACLGLLVYAAWPVLILGAAFWPQPTTKFILWLINAGAKLHIIKDREAALKNTEERIDRYALSVKELMREKRLFIRTLAMSVVFQALLMAIPYFVLMAFGGNVDFWGCLVTTTAVTSAVYFVPTPGNAGAAEGTFYAVFSAVSSGYVFWAMLVWRLITYYSYILMGAFEYMLMHLEKRRKKGP